MVELKPIIIAYDGEDSEVGQKSLRALASNVARHSGILNTAAFETNLTSLCSQIAGVLGKVEDAVAKYSLESVELTVEVKASGEIRFVGSVGAEVTGGLKLAFQRQK